MKLKFDMTEQEISEMAKIIAEVSIDVIKVIAKYRVEQAIEELPIRLNEKDSFTISFPVEFSALSLFSYLQSIKRKS